MYKPSRDEHFTAHLLSDCLCYIAVLEQKASCCFSPLSAFRLEMAQSWAAHRALSCLYTQKENKCEKDEDGNMPSGI